MRLKDRVAVVTGAGRGIGRGIALAYAREGAKLVAAARTEPEIAAVAEEARELAGDAMAVATDVGEREDVERLIRMAVERFGKLDILVNNAGILGAGVLLHKMDDGRWEEFIRINLTSVFWSTREALRVMLPRRYGRIVNISSIAGKTALPFYAAYTATKHAVIGLAKSVAMEVAKEGITVNCICPGYVDTPMFQDGLEKVSAASGKTVAQLRKRIAEGIPMGRIVQVEDIVGLAVYLASDESAAVTGQAITISGGQLMA